jgi:hypothetical protein
MTRNGSSSRPYIRRLEDSDRGQKCRSGRERQAALEPHGRAGQQHREAELERGVVAHQVLVVGAERAHPVMAGSEKAGIEAMGGELPPHPDLGLSKRRAPAVRLGWILSPSWLSGALS